MLLTSRTGRKKKLRLKRQNRSKMCTLSKHNVMTEKGIRLAHIMSGMRLSRYLPDGPGENTLLGVNSTGVVRSRVSFGSIISIKWMPCTATVQPRNEFQCPAVCMD